MNYYQLQILQNQKEIYETIQSRISTPKSDYLSVDEMAKKFNINMSSL